jgi:hypothetical protein
VSASLSPDSKQIKKAIATLHGPRSVIELRAVRNGGRKRVDVTGMDDHTIAAASGSSVEQVRRILTAADRQGAAAFSPVRT